MRMLLSINPCRSLSFYQFKHKLMIVLCGWMHFQLSVHIYNNGTLLDGPTDLTYLVSLIPEGTQWAPSRVRPVATNVVISFNQVSSDQGALVKLCRFVSPSDCQQKAAPTYLPDSQCNHK